MGFDVTMKHGMITLLIFWGPSITIDALIGMTYLIVDIFSSNTHCYANNASLIYSLQGR